MAVLLLLQPITVTRAQDATSAAGEWTVIESVPVELTGTPTGDQTLQLAGPVSDLRSLDPAFARDLTAAFFARQMFSGLMTFDAEMNAVPALAETIEISPDGTTYRFTLRDGATFHDGRPITADDVVASYTRALNPATAGGDITALGGPTFLSDIVGADALIRGETDTLDGVQAIDDRTVEITLKAPRSTFLMKLAGAPAAIVDSTEVGEADWWRTPNGSGPFRVEEWVPEDHMTLKRFDSYLPDPAYLETVNFRLGPMAGNAFNLFQSGQIDMTELPGTWLSRIEDDPNFAGQLQTSPMLSTSYITFRDDVAPMDDLAVRRAVALAFPREKLAEVSLAGLDRPAFGLLPPGLLGREWDVANSEYDLEAAKAMLATSSYAQSGEPIPPIQVFGVGPWVAEILRETVGEDLGLEFEVIDTDWPTLIERLGKQDLPGFELLWQADYPDPESFLWSLFGSDSPDNYSGYSNPEFDALLDEARNTLDLEERAAIYAEAHQLLMDDGVVLPVVHDVQYSVSKPWVKGIELTPLGLLDLSSIWLER